MKLNLNYILHYLSLNTKCAYRLSVQTIKSCFYPPFLHFSRTHAKLLLYYGDLLWVRKRTELKEDFLWKKIIPCFDALLLSSWQALKNPKRWKNVLLSIRMQICRKQLGTQETSQFWVASYILFEERQIARWFHSPPIEIKKLDCFNAPKYLKKSFSAKIIHMG